MTRFVAISRERHGEKKWRRPQGFGFAASQAVAPVVATELGSAGLSLPLAFTEEAGRYALVAVLSLAPGRNLFVAPDGQWLGGHIPASFRAYPFRLAARADSNERILCIDEESGVLVEQGDVGEPFFDEAGNPSAAVQEVLRFCGELDRSTTVTELAVEALRQSGVIRPWPISQKTDAGQRTVNGLHRVDEAALNALDDETFRTLRARGALPIAYTQILAAGHFAVLDRLARIQKELAPKQTPESLDVLFAIKDDGLIQF
jgi:SapC